MSKSTSSAGGRRSIQLKRELALRRIAECLTVGLEAKNDISRLPIFLSRFSKLETHCANFETHHLKLCSELTDPDDLEKEDEVRLDFDDKYFRIIEIHSQLTSNTEPTPSGESRCLDSSVKLPRLNLLHFDGDVKAWGTFYDMFNTMVHQNKKLSNIERFSILLSLLHGEPLQLLKGFPLSENNYLSAYGALVDRYQCKRKLAFHHWEELHKVQCKSTSPAELRHLVDTFKENIAVLKNLRLPVDSWDFPLFHLLISKLDVTTRERFELQNNTRDIPSFSSLLEFLDKASQALDLADTGTSTASNKIRTSPLQKSHFNHDRLVKPRTRALVVDNRAPIDYTHRCVACQDNHLLTHCPSFQSLNSRARYDFVKKNKCCVNCLRIGHIVKSCPSIHRCNKCRASHHTLLHFGDASVSNSDPPAVATTAVRAQTAQSNTPASVTLFTDPSNPQLHTPLLATAMADVLDSHGNYRKIRIVIDSGSQSNFITKSCANRLGLSLRRVTTSVEGIGCTSSAISAMTSFRLLGLDSSLNAEINSFVVSSICSSMPASRINTKNWPVLKSLRLADSNFNVPGPVDALVGVDVFCRIFVGDRIDCTTKGPTAFKTKLGWIVMGNVLNTTSMSFSSLLCNSALESQLKKFWEIDEFASPQTLSDEDALCENIFTKTHTRDSTSGRYVVRLPFKTPSPIFGNSFSLAHCRLFSLEKRLSRSPDLRDEYNAFMQDYLDAGHMELIDKPTIERAYYIPHHCVLKPSSTTTRLRVVFDGTARPSDGPSLNDQLLVGPKLQTDINSILLRFRLHRVAFMADVRQMYRQVALSEQDRDWQRILFRFDPTQPIRHYRLNTVTYGLASSSFLALRTILQVAEDEGKESPIAQKVLSRDVYVDDVVTGAATVEAACELQKQLISILDRGCFELRKWTSNSKTVLDGVPVEHRCNQSAVFDNEDQFFVKVLGLQWNPSQDTFSYQCNPRHEQCTKRHVLSELARIFDPLGFIAPLTFSFKCIIQRIWTLGLDWDDPVPEVIAKDWSCYRLNTSSLAELSVPRFIPASGASRVELHGFCDASELGYAAVVYFRIVHNDNCVTTHLVISRSKVASLKKISIPRLELCAAVLLSGLVDQVKDIYHNQINFDKICCWSDSTVTLAWLRSPSTRWKTFVGNRVSIIQDRLPFAHWHHVRSEHNPADCASRGLKSHELLHHPLWWSGPEWLSLPTIYFEKPLPIEESIDTTLEERQPPISLFIAFEQLDNFLDRYSSLDRVTRIVAYVRRFTFNCRNSRNRNHGHLIASELKDAMLTLVKIAQASSFSHEIDCLKRGILLPKPLRKLHPFLDEGGLIRVGGRLFHSELAYDSKHPLLLSRQHRLTDLLIDQVHKDNFHPGLRTLTFLLAQNYWILSSRRAINSRLSKCIRCYRTNPRSVTPLMGNLPKLRVSQVKPFSCVGADFAGPFPLYIKRYRGARPFKAYICLFVCFATKAIHLELVCSLSSEAFLAALRRFIARRGRCQRIHCDQGTNFVGASNSLSSLMREAASTEAIEFSFNPPAAPHFGGLWEINVRAFKTHLIRTVGNQILTHEEFSTLVVQIEALLNSRPLCEMGSDPNDMSVLTPGHFLTLEPLTSLPERQNLDNINCLDRWHLVQKIHRDFWKRWHVEYLHTLNQRAKWHINSNTPKIGSLVLIKDDQLKPLQWSLARIVSLHPGSDGISRVATVKTKNGQFLRPLVKLCPLPLD